MLNITRAFIYSVGFLTLAASCPAQLIMSQIADGSNWRTAIVLTNTTATASTASLTFHQDSTSGATVPWSPPFLETSNTQNMPIAAGGTIFLHTPGTAAALSQGWGLLTGTGVVGTAIYTYESYNGRPDQDGTSDATAPATRILVPFDNTNSFVTSMAIANPNATAETVNVNIKTDGGTVTTATLPSPSCQRAIGVYYRPATAGDGESSGTAGILCDQRHAGDCIIAL